MRNKKLIVANWKMFPETEREAKALFKKTKVAAGKLSGLDVVICPPALYLSALKPLARTDRCMLGAQDIAGSNAEEQTGALGAEMLRNAGARFVIVGHSERRGCGESNSLIADKVLTAVKSGFRAVVCFGEDSRDESGAYLELLKDQLIVRLSRLPKGSADRLALAYEPIWAVGSHASAIATPDDVHQIAIYSRRLLIELIGKAAAEKVLFLYGGSTDDLNAASFLADGVTDGLLVGRSSRKADVFARLLRTVANV